MPKRERRAIMDWLVTAGYQPVHSYRPDSATVQASCLGDVASCDLYVLIVGHRYGFQPAEDNPDGLSITHLLLGGTLCPEDAAEPSPRGSGDRTGSGTAGI